MEDPSDPTQGSDPTAGKAYLGASLREVVPATAARYGHRVIPMDDALLEP